MENLPIPCNFFQCTLAMQNVVANNTGMGILHSVRARIIIISLLLLIVFLFAYSFTIWTVANSYALENTSQNLSISLGLIASDMERSLDNIKALVTRIAIDNELKGILTYGDRPLRTYYESFSDMIQSNPSFSVIDRFIVTDSSFSEFIQVGSNSISEGRPLRQDYLLREAQHLDISDRDFSAPYFSELSYGDVLVISILSPIINYNNGLTLGYIYAAVSIDRLLSNLYAYQRIDNSELYFSTEGVGYRVGDNSIMRIDAAMDEEHEAFLEINNSVVYKDGGRYCIKIRADEITITEAFNTPSIFTYSPSPLAFLAATLALLSAAVAIILYLYLNRAIYRPIRKLSARIERIQHSDFSIDETINTDDEFGLIGRGINKLSGEVTDLMDKRVQDEKTKLELEYRMLQNQINPHFLYNTFNSIRWMAKLQGAEGIEEMITALARVMKNISKKDESMATLSDEVAFIDDYMVIMKYRYGNTISYVKSIDKDCEGIKLPRFTLQPLVENAIFHGIEPKGTGALVISARDYENHAIIMIADNGTGFQTAEARKGDGVFKNIGIENVKQRLDYSLGGMASLSIESWSGAGTVCRIRIEKGGKE